MFYMTTFGMFCITTRKRSEILRSRGGTVPSKGSKIVIFVCILIKFVSVIVQCVYFVVKFNLSQI